MRGTAASGATELFLKRGMLLWVALLAYATWALTVPPEASLPTIPLGPIDMRLSDPILALAFLLGFGRLARSTVAGEHSMVRAVSRVLLYYLFYELLVVIPVALWIGAASWSAIIRSMLVRFVWLMFPILVAVFAEDRLRHLAGGFVAIAAACLVLWGLYLVATGGGGLYEESGVMRFRYLWGVATALLAWPLCLGLSGAVPRRITVGLLGISIVGQVLTNHRSGLIAMVVAGFFCLWMSGRLGRAARWVGPLVLVGAIVGLGWSAEVGSMFGYTFTRLLDFSGGTGADRILRWKAGWAYLVSRPVNDWVWSWRWYLENTAIEYGPHNFFLEIGAEEGVAGLVFYGAMLTMAFRGAWRWVRRDVEVRALVTYMIALIVYSLANASWYRLAFLMLLVTTIAGLVARLDQLRAVGKAGLEPAR